MLPKGQSGFDFLEQVKKKSGYKEYSGDSADELGLRRKGGQRELERFDYLVKVKTKPDQVLAKVNKLLSRP